jgi:peptidoglycan hydrolase-like protein with peptidoglycan-binding domain
MHSAWASQEADRFVTQMNLGVTRTKEGHEILTRIVADDVGRSMPGVYIDRAALLRGVTRPDKGTGSVVDSGRSIVHSVDADQQKRHSLRTRFNQSTSSALAEIQSHLRQLQVQALDAALAGSPTRAFEMIGEALHLIQDSYSQAHTERANIDDINAPHPIRKVRFFGFIGPRPSRYPDEHQVIGYSFHVPFGDPRDDIHVGNGNLKHEAQAAINASREFLIMMLEQMARRDQPPYEDLEHDELQAFIDWHLSTNPVHSTPSSALPSGPSPTPSHGSTPVPPPSSGRPVLRRGSRGSSVRELQSRLNRWLMSNPQSGLQQLVVDGQFGQLTYAVVLAFQKAEGLTADGIVGPRTWARLLRLRPSPAPPSPPEPQGAGYPRLSRFVPAKYFTRPARSRQINRIVIHITDGTSTNGTVSWFKNMLGSDGRPAVDEKGRPIKVSAHYVVGQDGEVVQMVRDSDIAWHAHNANADSIGIEHVARARNPRLVPSQIQYCSSANLVRCFLTPMAFLLIACIYLGTPRRIQIRHIEVVPTPSGIGNTTCNWSQRLYHVKQECKEIGEVYFACKHYVHDKCDKRAAAIQSSNN